MKTESAAILGMGYLGRPLAEALWLDGLRLSALKHRPASEDAALPFPVATADLNRPDIWQQPFWARDWADKQTWIALLPPSPFTDYAGIIARWVGLAEQFGINALVFAGSISVYGNSVRDCDENSPPQADTPSARAILAAETVLHRSRIANIAILRLGGLYCAERHPLYRIGNSGTPLARPHAPANMLHRDRAVAALARAAAEPAGRYTANIVETPHPDRIGFYTAEAAKLGLPAPVSDPTDTNGGKRVFSRCRPTF